MCIGGGAQAGAIQSAANQNAATVNDVNSTLNGGVDWDAYEKANPDLAAEAAKVVGKGGFATKQDYYAWHDANYGGEGRNSTGTTKPGVVGDAKTGAIDNLTQTATDATNTANGAQTAWNTLINGADASSKDLLTKLTAGFSDYMNNAQSQADSTKALLTTFGQQMQKQQEALLAQLSKQPAAPQKARNPNLVDMMRDSKARASKGAGSTILTGIKGVDTTALSLSGNKLGGLLGGGSLTGGA